MKANAKWILLILIVLVFFFWKIVFTHQFSILMQYETANQAYAWYHFEAASLKQGLWPLWDPYTFSGRSFVGGMETAPFYPLKLLLLLLPQTRSGRFSPVFYHYYYVFTHFLAGCFLFLLAKELSLNNFSAFAASLCFSLGGFMSKIPWPDMLDSAIWLPLILLFLFRALRGQNTARGVLFACLAGLGLGMTILAGRIHVVIMDILVVVSFAGYLIYRATRESSGSPRWGNIVKWGFAVIVLMAIVAFCFGAIQLLPVIEHSRLTVRYIGSDAPLPSTQRIPYAELRDEFSPRSIVSFLIGMPFEGQSIGGEFFSPYFGTLPLILVIVGVWKNWNNPWVRYLALLAVLVFFYTLGPFSALHGLLYSLIPYLWIARGAARFIYLTHFAMALLAGFGIETLISSQPGARPGLEPLLGFLKWTVVLMALALGVPALYGKPNIADWTYLSFLLIFASYGAIRWVLRGHETRAAPFVIAALILCDHYAFYWIIQSRIDAQKSGKDYFQELLDCRNVANFLKSQRDFFRVHLDVDWEPNIGNLFGVQTTGGPTVATELKDYNTFRPMGRALELLNVKYIVRRAAAAEPNPIYSDRAWKVYLNPSHCPRAWLVHQISTEVSSEIMRRRIEESGFDPLQVALVSEPLYAELEPKLADAKEEIQIDLYQATKLQLTVRAQSRSLLVLSEVYSPGWRATVNGEASRIYKVNGLLRGIVIPRGERKVALRYAPTSIMVGAALTFVAFGGTLAFALYLYMRKKPARRSVTQ